MTVAVDAVLHAGEFAVRADFRLTEEQGPVVALFGPSGSGKSLTLALIAGLLRPDEGTVRIGDRLVADAAVLRPDVQAGGGVGVVFQEALLLPHRTVVDNVALAVRGGSRAQRQERAREELALVGADHLAGQHPRTLSGGERQRVALARALAGDPELLLLDEPLSALDQPTRVALRALLKERITVPTLLVTHDLDEVRALAHSVVRYEPGRTLDVSRVPGPAAASPRGPWP